MFSNFRKTFRPTKEEKAEQYAKINQIIKEGLEKNGYNCHNCSHGKPPVNNPFDCAIYCDVSEKVTEAYEIYVCDKYNFMGWFEEW